MSLLTSGDVRDPRDLYGRPPLPKDLKSRTPPSKLSSRGRASSKRELSRRILENLLYRCNGAGLMLPARAVADVFFTSTKSTTCFLFFRRRRVHSTLLVPSTISPFRYALLPPPAHCGQWESARSAPGIDGDRCTAGTCAVRNSKEQTRLHILLLADFSIVAKLSFAPDRESECPMRENSDAVMWSGRRPRLYGIPSCALGNLGACPSHWRRALVLV